MNNIFFSLKFLKSHLDVVTQPITGGADIVPNKQTGERMVPASNFVRKQAALNLVKMLTASAAMLAVADLWDDEAVEWDPRSADFGKIKIGNSRWDVTGNLRSFAVLAARMASGQIKTAKGDMRPAQGGSPLWNFTENKLSPFAGAMWDIFVDGQTYEGERPTVASIAQERLVPMGINNFLKLQEDPIAKNDPIFQAILTAGDFHGLSAQTYDANKPRKKPGPKGPMWPLY